MSGQVQAGPVRGRWLAMTPSQQAECLRLTVVVLAAAVAGSAQGVATALATAGAMSPLAEEHVLWAAREMTGPLRLVGDMTSSASRWIDEGAALRAAQANDEAQQQGLFS